MATLQEAQDLISSMKPSEKAQLIGFIAQDFDDNFPGIEIDPDIASGEPCILRTRIPVWVLVHAWKLGASESDLLKNYQSLRAEDLVNAWGYYRLHREKIDQQIAENEKA